MKHDILGVVDVPADKGGAQTQHSLEHFSIGPDALCHAEEGGREHSQQYFTHASAAHRGDLLLAIDHTRSGHGWNLIDDEPWKQAYVVVKSGVEIQFLPADRTQAD